MALIRAKHVGKKYPVDSRFVTVLRDINFEINEGEFVAITGKSGCGKSTLLNIIGCLDIPTSGEYFLENKPTSKMSQDELAYVRNIKIGFIFQQFSLLPDLTALENVALPQLYAGKTEAEANKRAREILAATGLKGFEDYYPNQLSGGQQQRVAIARGLVNEPKIIVADEPTGNLDTKTSNKIMNLFIDLNQRKKITVILVTHEPDLAHQAQRIITLVDGKIVSNTKK